MTESSTPADDRTEESADMVADSPESDPADMAGVAAEADAEKMHGESDQIAEDGDPQSSGHGPDASETP